MIQSGISQIHGQKNGFNNVGLVRVLVTSRMFQIVSLAEIIF